MRKRRKPPSIVELVVRIYLCNQLQSCSALMGYLIRSRDILGNAIEQKIYKNLLYMYYSMQRRIKILQIPNIWLIEQ